ncbi:hypothetical protein FM120_08570 [Sphingobacterium faecium PCAi_F2.5]|nr:hypothetical protein FM120_08570 [Sphingobacterium faecium PCAi_F2.5]
MKGLMMYNYITATLESLPEVAITTHSTVHYQITVTKKMIF